LKKKICLIVDDYLPHSIKVAAKMMHELAVEFQRKGHEVTVLTPDPGISKDFENIQLDGIDIYKFRSGKIKNTGKIKRAINESLLSYNAWRILKKVFIRNRHDMIVYFSPSIFWGRLVSKLKKQWNAPSYMILRDFFPQWAIDSGILKKNSLITKYFQYFEKLNYQSADTIGIQSPANIEQFKKYNSDNYKLDLLFNWAADKPVITNGTPTRKKLNLESKVVFFYGGNIGHAQDMRNITHLAKSLLPYPEAHFVLIGAGDEFEFVKDAIQKESLNNMILLDAVPQDEFKAILSEFNIGLFSLHKDHTTHNFPGKVLGYMVQSMPILGCVNPGNDLKNVIEEANAGYVTISGDEEGLKENAIKLLDESKRKEMGINAKKLLHEKFSVESIAEQIMQLNK
jgi:glycosyltransferase involved in cell wall biosynthesis